MIKRKLLCIVSGAIIIDENGVLTGIKPLCGIVWKYYNENNVLTDENGNVL